MQAAKRARREELNTVPRALSDKEHKSTLLLYIVPKFLSSVTQWDVVALP